LAGKDATLSKGSDRLRQENQKLRRELAHRKQVDAERRATIVALREQLEQLQEQVALLKKALFAPRRERFIPSADQKLLFEPERLGCEEEAGDEGDGEDVEEQDEVPDPPCRRPRLKRKRFEFPQCLPVKRIEYPLPADEQICPCGCGQRAVIHQQITRQLEYQPSTAYVVEHVRYTYGCPQSREGRLLVRNIALLFYATQFLLQLLDARFQSGCCRPAFRQYPGLPAVQNIRAAESQPGRHRSR
jgi:hypothetical protein